MGKHINLNIHSRGIVLLLIFLAILLMYTTYSYGLKKDHSESSAVKSTPRDIIENIKTCDIANTTINNLSFQHGTYRITKPGHYILQEDVVFSPQEDDLKKYQKDPNIGMAYKLGFFAAITIECDDVTLNLNGFSIKQSKKHYISQRFFACIELGHSPFMAHQGPAVFTYQYRGVCNITIENGKLGRSSHHGIHGNVAHGVLIRELDISQFEVSGIALNGCVDVVIQNVNIGPVTSTVPVDPTFSHTVALLRMFDKLSSEQFLHTITLKRGECGKECIDGQTIYTRLKTHMQHVSSTKLEQCNIPYSLSEGNAYGIVLNSAGAVVQSLPPSGDRKKRHILGNQCIRLEHVNINGIFSQPKEVKGLKLANVDGNSYGLNVEKDAGGAVFAYTEHSDVNGGYSGDVLSDAQIWISSLQHVTSNEGSKTSGTTPSLSNLSDGCPFAKMYIRSHNHPPTVPPSSITPRTVEWASGTDVDNKIGRTLIGGGDSMGHVMKGNFGILVNQGVDITMEHLNIENVQNFMLKPMSYNHNHDKHICGDNAIGILINSSENVLCSKIVYKGIKSCSRPELVKTYYETGTV